MSAPGSYSKDDDLAWRSIRCPDCTSKQAIVLALRYGANTCWAKCVGCGKAIAVNSGVVSPPSRPLRRIEGLPSETEYAWSEVRDCLSVRAATAAVQMARKIILHVAVEKGLPEKDDKGRAPTFAACVEYLETEGFITQQMTPWLNRIREVGNAGAHEIEPVTNEQGLDVARFVEQLLVMVYEMPALMEAGDSIDEPPASPNQTLVI